MPTTTVTITGINDHGTTATAKAEITERHYLDGEVAWVIPYYGCQGPLFSPRDGGYLAAAQYIRRQTTASAFWGCDPWVPRCR